MHRRLLPSLASAMGAAALVAAPLALVAPAAQAAPVVSAVIDPTDTLPHEPDFDEEGFWGQYLAEEEDIDAACVKETTVADPYTIPEPTEFFEVEPGVELAYVLAVVKGDEEDSTKVTHKLYWEPEVGDQLSHAEQGNAHVILCLAELGDETSGPSPTTTGPVVETDRVAPTGSDEVLGPIAAAVVVAGAGALLLGRRRQGTHR